MYVICIASIICADDVVGKNALALPYNVRNKKNAKNRKDGCFSSNVAGIVFIACKICVVVTQCEFSNTAGISFV